MPYRIDAILERCCDAQGKRIQLSTDQPPRLYIRDNFTRIGSRPLSNEDLRRMIRSITPDDRQRELEADGRTYFDFDFGNMSRFHVHIETTANGYNIVINPVSQ